MLTAKLEISDSTFHVPSRCAIFCADREAASIIPAPENDTQSMLWRDVRTSDDARCVQVIVDPSAPGSTIFVVSSPDAELSMSEHLRQEYEQMLVRAERSRDRAARLRALAEQATDQVASDERLLKSLAEVLGLSPQATLADLGGGLRGQRLREVAVEVLARRVAPGDTVHYREWYAFLQQEDIAVAGRDPLATFLAQVSRSEAVEAVGRRSGRYRLRAVA